MTESVIIIINLILLLISFYFLATKQRGNKNLYLSYIAISAISFDHIYIQNPFIYIALNSVLTGYIAFTGNKPKPENDDAVALGKVLDSILTSRKEKFSFKKSLKVSSITLIAFLFIVAIITTQTIKGV